MTEKHKQVFRKINMDNDVRSLQPGDYRFLRNGINIQGTSVDGLENAITSIYGNALVTNASLEASSNIVGFVEDRVNNRAFFAVYHETNPTIYQVTSAGVVSIVMRSSVLGFGTSDFVDMKVIGDILLFTNNVLEIKKISITKAIASFYATVSEEKIALIARPPKVPPTAAVTYDATVNNNNIYNNYFQFYYRYIYHDNAYSVFSAASIVYNSWTPASIVATYVATTNVTLNGFSAVDGITLVNDNKILVVGQTNPVENGVYLAKVGAWVRTNLTAGDVPTATFVYVTSGFNFLDTCWQFIDTGVVIIGTDAMYFRQIQGPNKYTVSISETAPATVSKIEYAVRINGSNELIVYRVEVTSFASSHSFYNDSYLFTVSDAESFKWNDSVPLKSKSLEVIKNRLILFNNTEGYTHALTSQVVLSTSSVGLSEPIVNSVRKAGGTYGVGLMFFDFAGRHSGVQCASSITIPDTNPSPSFLTAYNIQVDASAISAPSWASHFSIVMTKCLNIAFFLKDTSQDIYHYKLDGDGVYTYSKGTSGMTGTLIDIGCLVKSKRGYTFNAGDRVKLYVIVVAGQTNTIIDVPIQGQVGNFIITRLLTELGTLSGSVSTNIIFEIYTPKSDNASLFYEIGQKYVVASMASPITVTNGDVEMVKRNIYKDTSAIGGTDPFANTYDPLDQGYLESMNLWEANFDKWIGQEGRGIVRSVSLEINKYNYIRFGGLYIETSTILGLNTFEAIDEYALPIENGPGTLLVEAGDILVGLHEIESTAIYVGDGFVNTSAGNSFLAKTDSVIGDDRRYLGGHGTTHPTSVVSRDSRVYFYDSKKGCIVRRSQDGLTVISDYGIKGLVSYLATLHNASPSTSRIVAGWDPQYDCYCISFFLTGGSYNFTLYFHEKTNAWVCASDLMPYRFGTLGQYQLAFTSTAALYKQTPEANYNLFFGTQYNRSLEWEISPLDSLVKILEAIELDQTNLYSTAGTNEELVSVYLIKGGTKQTMINYTDFRQREGVWRSAFFKMITDVNFVSALESKFKSPFAVRGQSFYLTLAYNGTDKNILKSITTFFRPKMYSST